MDYTKIFNRFASAESTKVVEFSSMNMDEKLAYLAENSETVINDSEKYAVNRTVRKSDYESLTDYFKAGIAIGATAEELISAESVSKTVKIAGKDLSKRDRITVMSRDMDLSDGKITVARFGGSNFVNFCKWVREMSADEFETICNTK